MRKFGEYLWSRWVFWVRWVRTYETAEDPVPWADRPDIYWCIGCDQYHRTDHEHEVTA